MLQEKSESKSVQKKLDFTRVDFESSAFKKKNTKANNDSDENHNNSTTSNMWANFQHAKGFTSNNSQLSSSSLSSSSSQNPSQYQQPPQNQPSTNSAGIFGQFKKSTYNGWNPQKNSIIQGKENTSSSSSSSTLDTNQSNS